MVGPITTLPNGAVKRDGLTVKAIRGDRSVLLAFDLDESDAGLREHLAGFAVKCIPPSGRAYYLKNRLTFKDPVVNTTTPVVRQAMPTASNVAPFQIFRWVHIPSNWELAPGNYTFEVTAMYFDGGDTTGDHLRDGASVSVQVELANNIGNFAGLEIGFTRAFLSSQAYHDRFHNADIGPTPRTLDYPTAAYQKRYEWLGFHAREMVFKFLDECIQDPEVTVDVLVYDIDEPDFVQKLVALQNRLRIYMDDSTDHIVHKEKNKKTGVEKTVTPLEVEAHKRLVVSAGQANVEAGHFARFAHCKVLIKKKNGVPVKVLTGSANFSVRGLYVQANNVLVFDNAGVAGKYEQAFNQTFTSAAAFNTSQIAHDWLELTAQGLPTCSVCFSPHEKPQNGETLLSLSRVQDGIQQALDAGPDNGSVLFAVMGLDGKGPVLTSLKELYKHDVFSYGVTQSIGKDDVSGKLGVIKPGQTSGSRGLLVPFEYLSKHVPPPFSQEISGGQGQVIHHKFVVVNFNGPNPTVYTGSSNLAEGGEEDNGDNLLEIKDASIAQAYAVQAVMLLDHYHFRALMYQATDAKPMKLKHDDATDAQGHDDRWWLPFFEDGNIKQRDRRLFVR